MLATLASEPLFLGSALIVIVIGIMFALSVPGGRWFIEDRLRHAGFRRQGDHFVGQRDGIELRATLSRPDTHYWLEIVGPANASRAPTFRAASPGPHPHRVVTGDAAFDDAVLTEHPDPHEGLSWLDANGRATVRDAVALPARVVDGRWRYRAICSTTISVAAAADALARAYRVSSEGRSIDEGLDALANHDPEPHVRARAIQGLAHRGRLTPELLSRVVEGHDAEVPLALVVGGGQLAIAAWRAVVRTGNTRQRAEGAIAMSWHLNQGRLDTATVDLDDVVSELVRALKEPTQAHLVPEALKGLGHPDLLRCLLEHGGDDLPKELAPLIASLRDTLRPRVGGGVSLAQGNGGGLAVVTSSSE